MRTSTGSRSRSGLTSVIVPVRDGRDYLLDAVQSVLNQSHSDLEVVVVDDGSTDGSHELISSLDDSRVRLVRQSPHGLAAARNRGVAESGGDYVAFLDADDQWEPTKLETQLALIGERIVVYSDVCFWDAETRHAIGSFSAFDRFPSEHSKFDGRILMTLLAQNVVHPSTLLVLRRDFYDIGPFNEGLLRCEDWDFVLRASETCEFIRAPQSLVRVARRSDSLQGDRSGMRDCGKQVLNAAKNRLKSKDRLTGPQYGALGMGYFTSRNMLSAFIHLSIAAARQPWKLRWWKWLVASVAWSPLALVRRSRA